MDAIEFTDLAAMCAPAVHVATTSAIVGVESSFNPYAVGVVGGQLIRQPRSRAEALVTVRHLQDKGWNYSVGLAQINVANFSRLDLDAASALDPCRNLAAMQVVLAECFERAGGFSQQSLRRALSCYYSGNFRTGFRHGYVQKVVRRAASRPTSGAPP